MCKVEVQLTLELRQRIMAASKPYESFDATILRVLSEGATPVRRVKPLRRSVRRWEFLTEELYAARLSAALDTHPYGSLIRSLRKEHPYGKGFRRSTSDSMADCTEYREFSQRQAHKEALIALYRIPVGSRFTLKGLCKKVCPHLGGMPSFITDDMIAKLLKSRSFMQRVSFSKEKAGLDVILHRVEAWP